MLELTEENYFSFEANCHFMSVSQLKDWLHCEAKAYSRYVDGVWPEKSSSSLLMGKYLAAKWAGAEEFSRFMSTTPQMFRKDGQLKANFLHCEQMYERGLRDPLFKQRMAGEHNVIFTAKLFGTPWKCRIELLNREHAFITDLMTCRDFADVWQERNGIRRRLPFYEANRSFLRLGIYQRITALHTGFEAELYVAAVTKQTPPDINVISFNSRPCLERIAFELKMVETKMAHIARLKRGEISPAACGECDYCRENKVLHQSQEAQIN